MNGIHRIVVVDKTPTGKEGGWGTVVLNRATPTSKEYWGVYALLRGTPWEALVREITSGALNTATRGGLTPLMRELFHDPARPLAAMDPPQVCAEHRVCSMYDRKHCLASKSPKMPDCYTPPVGDHTLSALVYFLLNAVRKGEHVIVVDPTDE